MTQPSKSVEETTQTLRIIALRYPEVEEGIACQGTALECATFKVRNKAFLFLGAAEIKVKLDDSLTEADKYDASKTGCCKVGAHGWVAAYLGEEHRLPLDVLERWIEESYRLLAPKQLVESLAARKKSSRTSKRKG